MAAATVVAGACLLGLGWLMGHRHARRERPRTSETPMAATPPAGDAERSPPKEEPVEAALLFVGDVLPLDDWDYLASVKPLLTAADFAVCNLECPLSTHGVRSPLELEESGDVIDGEFLFRAPPSQAERLAEAGLDAVTLANNHIMDYGGEALLETLSVLDGAGLKHTGAGPDIGSARQPLVCDVNGQRVALLAYVSRGTLPGAKGSAATDSTAGTAFVHGDEYDEPTATSRRALRSDIASTRKNADFVVTCFHWGTEERDQPDPLPRNLAHWSIDCGADMVIGHHPHVVQGIEIYDGRPIAYSLGNFAFSTPWEARRYGVALQVRVREGRWLELALYPMKLADTTGDPSPAEGRDLKRIRDRAIKLSAEVGTICECLDDDSAPRVVVRNPARADSGRREPQTADERSFFVEPHAELADMAAVHFLVWDLMEGHKVTRARQIVVCEALAEEVLTIFRQIYLDAEQFPIHDLVGYNYRTIPGGTRLSNHALGRAIDINRPENPMIRGGRKIAHPDELPYVSGDWRPGDDPYSMGSTCSVVRAFRQHGWRWGGDWRSSKDYQHFDKPAVSA